MKKTWSAKRWVLLFFILVFAGMLGYAFACFRANPEGYFTNIQGQPYYFKDDFSRAVKAAYMLEHKDEIDGIILGGSKCGAVDVDLMEECTGLRFYNMYLNLGNFKDYLAYTRFAAEKLHVKEIDLVLSCYEVLAYDRAYRGNNYHLPALVEGSFFHRITEFLSWLVVDPTTLKSSWQRLKKNPAYADALADGRRTRMSEILKFNRDPEAFGNKLLDDYDERLAFLFTEETEQDTDHTEVMEQNIAALKEMVSICRENDVKLRVIIGPATMTERYRYEDPSYYEYMLRIVECAGEVWDFSDYNEINMNLYNYADKLHYSVEAADLMVRTIFGKDSYEGFGQVLTPENAYAAIDARIAQYEALKEEYERTGTVKLFDRSHESYLPWRETWISSRAAEEQMGPYWESVAAGAESDEDEPESDDYE